MTFRLSIQLRGKSNIRQVHCRLCTINLKTQVIQRQLFQMNNIQTIGMDIVQTTSGNLRLRRSMIFPHKNKRSLLGHMHASMLEWDESNSARRMPLVIQSHFK